MNVVIYTTDLEPITVVDLPMWGIEMLETGQHFIVAVPMRWQSFKGREDATIADVATCQTCEMWGEPIHRGKHRGLLVFTNDETMALALRSCPLPGQMHEWQAQYKRGIAHAIIAAMGGYRG